MREDTHFDDAVDTRTLDEMRASDLVPFAAGIEAGADAVMLAHVAYPSVAPEPAGYSRVWIRSEEHTSELQSLMRISYAVFCLKKKKTNKRETTNNTLTE